MHASMRALAPSGLRPLHIGIPSRRLPICASYRWSAEGTTGRRRKQDSLTDNVDAVAVEQELLTEEDRVARLRRRREERRRQRELSGIAAETPRTPPTTDNEVDAAAAGWSDGEWGPSVGPPPEDTAWGWGSEAWAGEPGRQPQGGEYSAAQRRRSGTAASTSYGGPEGGSYSGNGVEYEEEEYEEEYGENYEESAPPEGFTPGGAGAPDISLLSPQELEKVLPLVPFSAQATYFYGGAAQSVQRWGASLALTVLLSKVALLAAGTLTWPLWWPWAQAASKNYSLRKQNVYAGLWRTTILDVEVRGRPRPQFGGAAADASRGRASSRFSTMRTTRITVGDPEGAQTEFVLPQDARYDLIKPGQPAELIVLSDAPSFESFKAVKDVYLPECGLWVSEYPFLDRTEFLELSLEVEREAMASEEEEESKNGRDFEDGSSAAGDARWENYEEEAEYYEDGRGYKEEPPQPPPRY